MLDLVSNNSIKPREIFQINKTCISRIKKNCHNINFIYDKYRGKLKTVQIELTTWTFLKINLKQWKNNTYLNQ